MTTDGHCTPVDVALIGGGIMSATLGAMLALLQPHWRVTVIERADALATESSHPWNNAGTGHSGYCELNYMPDPADGATPAAVAAQFALSRRWWAHLVETGLLDPGFVTTTPHMDVVFGDRDIAYLRRRFDTLRAVPAFAGMRYSQDPTVIAGWAPLVMAGRDPSQRVAATWHPAGTDIDFGVLTRQLTRLITGDTLLGHEARTVTRTPNGGWRIAGRCGRQRFELDADRVFIGAGGHTLTLCNAPGYPRSADTACFRSALPSCGAPIRRSRRSTMPRSMVRRPSTHRRCRCHTSIVGSSTGTPTSCSVRTPPSAPDCSPTVGSPTSSAPSARTTHAH